MIIPSIRIPIRKIWPTIDSWDQVKHRKGQSSTIILKESLKGHITRTFEHGKKNCQPSKKNLRMGIFTVALQNSFSCLVIFTLMEKGLHLLRPWMTTFSGDFRLGVRVSFKSPTSGFLLWFIKFGILSCFIMIAQHRGAFTHRCFLHRDGSRPLKLSTSSSNYGFCS